MITNILTIDNEIKTTDSFTGITAIHPIIEFEVELPFRFNVGDVLTENFLLYDCQEVTPHDSYIVEGAYVIYKCFFNSDQPQYFLKEDK